MVVADSQMALHHRYRGPTCHQYQFAGLCIERVLPGTLDVLIDLGAAHGVLGHGAGSLLTGWTVDMAPSGLGFMQDLSHLGSGAPVVGVAPGQLGELDAEGVACRVILDGCRVFFSQRGGVRLLVELENRSVVGRLLGHGGATGQQEEEDVGELDHGSFTFGEVRSGAQDELLSS